jgi:hypothetical protein
MRNVKAIVATALFVACGSPPKPVAVVGVSKDSAQATTVATASGAAAPPTTFTLPADYTKTWVQITPKTPSDGHAPGRWVGEVYGNPTAVSARSKGGSYPVGAILVERHEERKGDATAGPTFIMERVAENAGRHLEGWRFYALDSKGAMTPADASARARAMQPCALCHAEAPKEGLFLPALALPLL